MKSYREYYVAPEVYDAVEQASEKFAVLKSSTGSYTLGREMEFTDSKDYAMDSARAAAVSGVEALVVNTVTEEVLLDTNE
ncbi:hypothetical protein [Streptomyces sp. H27-C3]|uniref:hypothetical protein n=1 Tax=Streptomyces sp. H27-C3 TaxID=3046305 RepID=UPI0024BA85E6|nr:hypothetical protein [Streptomyces sp. H27-C3]MDJ0463092.1 hypothetical protein [Streptomyces sp. H27-C3]